MTHDLQQSTTPARRPWLWLVALAAIFALFFFVPDPGARSSSLSRAPDGLWAMRAYLEARGAEVELIDGPLPIAEAIPGADLDPGVLVIALPWQRFPSAELEEGLYHHLRSGGDIVLAYHGAESPAQEALFEAFRLTPTVELRSDPPFAPRAWWRHQTEHMTLDSEPGPKNEANSQIEIPALDDVPSAPVGAEVLFRVGERTAAIFEFKLQGGRILALPVDVLANAHLAENDHADILEGLFQRFDKRWRFDEYHHGLVRPELVERSAAGHAWDLFIVHLLLLYGLAVFAAGRSFGPAWSEARPQTGSTADFLRSLGVLHHQLGHHSDAARGLVERVRRLEPALDWPRNLPPELDPERVDDGPGLQDLATALSRFRGSSTRPVSREAATEQASKGQASKGRP